MAMCIIAINAINATLSVRLPFNWVHMSSSLDKPSFQVRHIKSPA
jgi:hypothetical protein